MDIFEPIREALMIMAKAESTEQNKLEKSCGIISSCYPPSELYPNGNRIEYQFPIKPNEVKFYHNKQWQN
jgi:hypothetical protein